MKLLHYKLLLLLLLGSIPSVNAQWQNGLWTEKQAYNWCFGNQAGLEFSSGSPTPFTGVQLNSQEGTVSVSDSNGQLLFYSGSAGSDGEINIWNKNHQVMINGTGLIGAGTSTQFGVGIPKPGNPDIYYIFQISQFYGLLYSEINMSLDGGLGAVTDNKNVMLEENAKVEKITAVHHANGQDIWLISHLKGSDEFIAYLISETGVSSTPVISAVGLSYSTLNFASPTSYAVGQLKVSPDGTKLADGICGAFAGGMGVQVFDFNNETGEITNPIFLDEFTNLLYGIEFSPNSRYLYGAEYMNLMDSNLKILQFDLYAGDESAIINSAITIINFTIPGEFTSYGSMQLAPDGKIYYIKQYNNSNPISGINVIDYPNNAGIAAVSNTVDIEGDYKAGLPTFIQSYFASGILYEGDCEGEATTFSTLRIPGIEAIAWDFGDPDSGADNASTDLEPSHTFSGPGTYTVTAVITSNGAQQTATTEVVVQAGPDAVIPAIENTSLCDEGSGSATFDLTANNQEILDGQDAALFTVTHYASEADVLAGTPIDTPDAFTTQGQTVYTQVVNTDTGCATLISYTLTVNPNPQATAPDTLTPCGNQEGVAILNLTDNDATILEGQDPSQFSVAYFSDAAQAESGTDPVDTPDAYDTAGETLYARVTNTATGCYSIVSFEVVIAEGDFIPGTISLTGCSPFDLTQGVEAFDTELDYSYYTNEADALSGSDAIATPQEYPLPAGTGFVYVRAENTEGCFDVAELVLETGDCTLPKGISPNNDGMNDSFDLTFLTGDGNGSLQVFNRYGMKVYEQGRYTNQWQGQDSSGNELPTGTYYYVLQLQESHPDFGSNISRWVYIQREN